MINEQPKKKSALLSISQLHTFEGHPYKVLDNEEMAALTESIKEQGVLSCLSSAHWKTESTKSSADTAPLLRELIDRIEVHETEGTGRNRTQRIVIHYRFVGYIELPEDKLNPPVKAETRQGVAVQYLTSRQTA